VGHKQILAGPETYLNHQLLPVASFSKLCLMKMLSLLVYELYIYFHRTLQCTNHLEDRKVIHIFLKSIFSLDATRTCLRNNTSIVCNDEWAASATHSAMMSELPVPLTVLITLYAYNSTSTVPFRKRDLHHTQCAFWMVILEKGVKVANFFFEHPFHGDLGLAVNAQILCPHSVPTPPGRIMPPRKIPTKSHTHTYSLW